MKCKHYYHIIFKLQCLFINIKYEEYIFDILKLVLYFVYYKKFYFFLNNLFLKVLKRYF